MRGEAAAREELQMGLYVGERLSQGKEGKGKGWARRKRIYNTASVILPRDRRQRKGSHSLMERRGKWEVIWRTVRP